MRQILRYENPVLSRVIRHQWKISRIFFALLVQSVLLLVICQLLFRAKLGKYVDLVFLSEAVIVLIIPPYLACSGLKKHFAPFLSENLLQISRMRLREIGLSAVFGMQIYPFCFLALTFIIFTILIPPISDINHLQVAQLHLVFGIYIIVSASVGGLWWHLFRHEIFATEITNLGWILLIGGVFLLSPLDRHLKNLEPIIPPFLHLNPLMAVRHLLEIDVFRTPHLYELTPIPSYRVVYPPWHIVCIWQILIGICCVALARWDRI